MENEPFEDVFPCLPYERWGISIAIKLVYRSIFVLFQPFQRILTFLLLNNMHGIPKERLRLAFLAKGDSYYLSSVPKNPEPGPEWRHFEDPVDPCVIQVQPSNYKGPMILRVCLSFPTPNSHWKMLLMTVRCAWCFVWSFNTKWNQWMSHASDGDNGKPGKDTNITKQEQLSHVQNRYP